MNKRFSTLLGVSLLFSSAFGSAWATDYLKVGKIADKLDGGKYYHLVMNDAADDPTKVDKGWAYGFTDYSLETKTITPSYIEVGSDVSTSEGVNPEHYLWKVQEVNVSVTSTPQYALILTNVATGQVLRFDSDFKVELDASDDKATDKVVWGGGWHKYAEEGQWLSRKLYVAANLVDETPSNRKSLTIFAKTGNEILAPNEGTEYTFSLCEAADENVGESELNALYNSVGFNLTLGKDYEDVVNEFDKEGQKILAVEVKHNVYSPNDYANRGILATEDGAVHNFFPAGTYFIVKSDDKKPSGLTCTSGDEYYDEESNKEMYNFLMDCEFVVVNPNDNKSDVAATRKSGEGFALTTISARSTKFNLFAQLNKDAIAKNTDKIPSGEEISVLNACFQVKKNASNSKKYAITLPTFYVNETSDASKQEIKKDHDLTVKSGTGYGASEYLVTANVSGYDYKFEFVESNAVDGTEFLYTDKAAIYNIKFVSGEADDHESEYGKYLFAPAYDDTNELYAKGSVLTDKNIPEFQFVITEVKGKNVTFANRANDKVKFTAQLFDEGNDVYSLGVTGGKNFTILDVQNNGDIKNVTDLGNLHLSHIVLETPKSTDKFNGTWNVEDETKVTLAFARDNTPTSNKVYPTAKYESNNFSLGNMSPEVSEAAQWQLNKSEKPNYITRTYAFRVGEGDKATVDYQVDGDSIAYYTYEMQLVKDGDLVKDRFLDASPGANTVSLSRYSQDFIVKDNIDGSVSIIPANESNLKNYAEQRNIVIEGYKNKKNDLSEFLKDGVDLLLADKIENPEAKYLEAFLLEEAPEKSWEEAGHVTIQSQKGDYVNMDEDRDGILVDNEAETLYLHMTDEKAVVPSFYISKAIKEGGNALSERMYLFNPEDSIDYYVASGVYNKTYQWTKNYKKVIFKAGSLDASCDTMTTNIKGKVATLASKADNNGTQGGLDRFKFQIVETEDGDGMFYIRQKNANDQELTSSSYADLKNYLISYNEGLSWGSKEDALVFSVKGVEAPTSNEGVAASEVKVVAQDGSVVVKNAAGKNVVVSTILGQVVANEVLTSDNATINVPAGIVVVAVEGESFKVNVK